MSIAAYIRVSSTGQNASGQRAEIERWLDGQAIAVEDVVWFEDKKTGKTLDRPGFDAMQKAVFMGEVKTVVVWRLDRLSRSQVDGINTLADWCEKGIRFVSVTQQFDFNGTLGRTIAGLLWGIAEMGLEAIKDRQAAGIAAAKKRGVYQNNSRPKGTTKAKPDRAIALREQGIRPGEIAKMLGVSRGTVYRYLGTAKP
ncbi:recombinase family protein [Rhodopirellula bahusiensis]|uniref:Resolvase n=1 Tax=Rhodopirellula bahusiensis TaxID=2014065 RepID=A0A2G1VXJ5_9BACT|nr:recombinase family protein [Rhodopirellula bahusiensis]PHQ31497.1 resolvase [Rhodopirellula bahusiensis]